MREAAIIQGAFPDSGKAERALRQLRGAGFEAAQIELLSSTPLHELAPHLSLKPSRARAIAILGGAIGAFLGYVLAAWTARAWPLETGAMPIVAPFTVGIIIFETTALVAIICTATAFLLGGRLLRSSGHLVGTSVLSSYPDGTIVIAVRCRTIEQAEVAGQILQQV